MSESWECVDCGNVNENYNLKCKCGYELDFKEDVSKLGIENLADLKKAGYMTLFLV